MSGFVERKLALTIQLGEGEFGENLGSTVTLTGFRMLADLTNPGGESMGHCQIRVYGLRADVINKLTSIGTINRAVRIQNAITLAAGDDVNGMQVVFKGTILDAWADYNGAPDVPFHIIANAGFSAAIKPVGATSYMGSVDVAGIMADLASSAGFTLENNKVDVKLSNPYFSGSNLDKIRECASAADILYVIDRDVLAIWPRTGSRVGALPLLSPDTGMVGYPTLSSKGMTVRSVFNWNLKMGADVKVQSSIPMANGTWRTYSVAHSLSSEMPDGPWFSIVECYLNVE